ncbi:Uncharacterised protein family (UPF0158) [Pedobacter suwonensis]|uniref:Uncharacterized protein family (UPF0158) n=1 Tax=Pedobacter suwonensis TaxID=332999 RepID=A0A1I0SXT2_9SPHI|nr:UPF0158 family protein [Pedobacter suwonensis]SFA44319.1 Uncharacterised protein family (UPF0158) [Pedobacter suwonensis]
MQDNDSDTWDEDVKEIETNPKEYIAIEHPDSRESFKFMEEFTAELPDNTRIKAILIAALSKRKHFRELNMI